MAAVDRATSTAFAVPPTGAGVRVDSGVATDGAVSPTTTPCWPRSSPTPPPGPRPSPRLAAALADARIHGVTTNRDLLVRILRHAAFVARRHRHRVPRPPRPRRAGRPAGRRRRRRPPRGGRRAGRPGRAAGRRARCSPRLPSGWRNNTVGPPDGHLRPRPRRDVDGRLPLRPSRAGRWPRSPSTAPRSTSPAAGVAPDAVVADRRTG